MDRDRSRRQILQAAAALAGCGALLRLSIRPAAATPEMMQDAVRAVIGEAPVKKGKVKLDLPPLVENGNSVPCIGFGREPDDDGRLRQGDPHLQ